MIAQQAPPTFRWLNFHQVLDGGPDQANDKILEQYVARALAGEDWTEIREIGVEYDAALVVTVERKSLQAAPYKDAFTVWSVSLTSHNAHPILRGFDLRLLDWTQLATGSELSATYDDCLDCDRTLYFTTFHYDAAAHAWGARWLRGQQAAPVWSAGSAEGVARSQAYAWLTDENGRASLATWNRYDYGKAKPAEDYVYLYDVDPVSGLDRTELLSGKHAAEIEQALCQAQPAIAGLARGQDSAPCLSVLKATTRPERKPVTTPPGNNRGQSEPPGGRGKRPKETVPLAASKSASKSARDAPAKSQP